MKECTAGPHVIGATGGSGTRIVARIVKRGGVFLGTNLNVSEDALDVARYLDRWINVYMARDSSPLSQAVQTKMIREFQTVLKVHCSPLGMSPRPYGWKEPRSIYLLPFFHSQFPGLKFLHVVRDGRDMAFSTNQNQLRKHGHTLLSPAEANWSQPLQSIALWSRVNLLAADYGETHLPGQYLRIRFEDLCAEPVGIIHQIFDFWNLQGDPEQIAQSEVCPPTTLGRWKNQDEETLVQLHQIGGAALQRFGYWSPVSR